MGEISVASLDSSLIHTLYMILMLKLTSTMSFRKVHNCKEIHYTFYSHKLFGFIEWITFALSKCHNFCYTCYILFLKLNILYIHILHSRIIYIYIYIYIDTLTGYCDIKRQNVHLLLLLRSVVYFFKKNDLSIDQNFFCYRNVTIMQYVNKANTFCLQAVLHIASVY